MRSQRLVVELLMFVLVLCSMGRAQKSSAAVEGAVLDTLHAMKVQATLVPGSLHFEQGCLRTAATGLIVERASISGSRIEARLHCRPANACLPFYAMGDLRFENEAVIRRSFAATERNRARQAVVMPGERVVYIREMNGVRMLVRAVTLQRSYVGQMTRVRALDGRHEIMLGRVFADHVVRSES